jgi:hypothetical protein
MLFWHTGSLSRWSFPWPAALFLAATILLGIQTPGLADVEPKRIMMLHSFGLRFKPWVDYSRTLRSEIRATIENARSI